MKKKIGLMILIIVVISNITLTLNASGIGQLNEINRQTSNNYSTVSIPDKYNTLSEINLEPIDQGITQNCWGITMTELMELAYAKKNNLTNPVRFSSRHMENVCSDAFGDDGFTRKVASGGRYEFGLSYFSSGKGPILEDDMPFVNTTESASISEIVGKEVQVSLKNYIEYPFIFKHYDENNNITVYSNGEIEEGKRKEYTETEINEFRNEIKKQIIKNGAVGAITYFNRTTSEYFSKEDGYVLGTSYFCNNTGLVYNHTVVIVGWDDTYSRLNFDEDSRPVHDGAYIALSSWGNEWNSRGDGTYYISYDDALVEKRMVGITEISDVNYDNIYQYDQFGENYNLGAASQNYIYGANVFTREDNVREELKDVGVYIVGDNTNIKIYLNNNGDDLTQLKEVGLASNLQTGYHRIELDGSYPVGKVFSVAVRYENNVNKACIPMEANYTSLGFTSMQAYNNAKSNIGESFYSLNGTDWYDIYNRKINEKTTLKDTNVCIKGFTTNNIINNNIILNPTIKLVEYDGKKYLVGLTEDALVENLPSYFVEEADIKVNNGVISEGKVGTGKNISIKINNASEQYISVLYGDVNQDAQINSVDALALVKHKLGLKPLQSDAAIEATKVTPESRFLNVTPGAIDALAIVKHKLGTNIIEQ